MGNYLKIIAVVLGCATMSGAVFSQETAKTDELQFYEKNTGGQWTVEGMLYSFQQAYCYAQTRGRSGEWLRVAFGMTDGTVRVVFENPNISFPNDETGQKFTGSLFTFSGDRIPNNKAFMFVAWTWISDHRVAFIDLGEKFLKYFKNAREWTISFSGNVNTIHVGLRGSEKAVEYMSDCTKTHRQLIEQYERESKNVK